MKMTLSQIASEVSGKLIGDEQITISGITNVENPAQDQITFITDPKSLSELEHSAISCILVPSSVSSSSKAIIQVKDPKRAWAKLLRTFYPDPIYPGTISPLASISPSAKLGSKVTVEPFAVIGDNVKIGNESVIRSHSVIGANVQIGEKAIIHPATVIYNDCQIGDKVVLHAGCVIGADGFGYVTTMESQEKVPQVGIVVIEDDVEIGASTTIDRATIGKTIIGKGTKIDNLVQIGHNVVIGPHTVISAQTGISGSCKIGSHVTMGGRAGLGDHVEIGDWTMVGAGSGIPSKKKIPGKQIVFGQPARPYQEARKQIGAQLRAAEMMDDIRKLKAKIAELEKASKATS